MVSTKTEIPRTYISLTDEYIKDYHQLAYKKYPSFQNMIYVDYYSMDLSYSHYDKNMNTFYNDIGNESFGGRFNRIHNFPIISSTNTVYDNEAGEKGITTQSSSELNFVVEPTLDFMVKPNDIIRFHIVDDYYGFYMVTNVDDSATVDKAYRKITAKLIANMSQDKLNNLVVNELVFVQEYHKIFDREVAILVLTIESRLQSYIDKLNSMYRPNLDFHVFEDDETVVTSYERAIMNMYKNYTSHILMEGMKLSYSYKAGFYIDEPLSAWDLMINPSTDAYYKRVKQMYDFNSVREIGSMKDHKYYAIDRSFEDVTYHNYKVPDDYTCSATLIAPGMTTTDFWAMIEAWRSALTNSDVTLFVNDTTNYNQRFYNLLYGWLEILVTKNYLKNKFNCTITYFDTYSTDATLLETSILMSQLLYINNYLTKNTSYKIPVPSPTKD